jgi:hypothetical protein
MMAKALPAGPTAARAWWREAVFYQVYPRSFADANGDGIGDLAGLTERLDYLVDLGIDAVWLSPHYPSPLRDLGYDISDFRGVDPAYGTIDDIVRLLEGAHRRGIRVVLDLVLNHTSDQHPWFVESRASAKSPRRDWYLWRPGRGAGPPNNWVSQFGGPAWQRDEATGEYFYHCFLPEQPDGRRRSALRDVHRAHRHLQPGTGVAADRALPAWSRDAQQHPRVRCAPNRASGRHPDVTDAAPRPRIPSRPRGQMARRT